MLIHKPPFIPNPNAVPCAPALTSRDMPEQQPSDHGSTCRPTRSTATKPGLPSRVIETSTLDRVSDPKLEIKKEASAPNGLYGVSYSVPTSGKGLSNITFPMSIDEGAQRKSARDGGIYFAMQFRVINDDGKSLGGGYIGMQPRQDGKALITFSGFGSHFVAPKGRPEADGGAGGSNSTLVDFEFGHKYNLTVERDPENPKILKGYIQDVTDPDNPGAKRHVKDIEVDENASLSGSYGGFVEHYAARINRSSQIAPTSGSFSAPFTVDDQGNVKEGSITSTGLYGRYRNSITGTQEVTKEEGVGKHVKFAFQGVGYEKKS